MHDHPGVLAAQRMPPTIGPTAPKGRAARPWVALLALLTACLAGGGTARAGDEPVVVADDTCAVPAVSQYLAVNASEPGLIRLLFFDAEGEPVVFSECVDGQPRHIGTVQAAPGTITTLERTWSCKRSVRHFAASATLPSGDRAVGSYSVRTPSCKRRFELRVPRRVRPGAIGRIRIVDRWGIGDMRTQLCTTAPGERRACRSVAFPRAVAVAGRRFRASVRGRWRVELRVRSHRVRASVQVGGDPVGAAARLPTVLATGDSTMQGIDNLLADDLAGAANVHRDVQPGTGITKLNPWARLSARHVRRLHPGTIVISVGANDFWPMTTAGGETVECCDEPWLAEYVERTRAIMQTYARGGHARVLWLTLVVPRDPRRVPVFAAVNRAVLAAAEGLEGVRILRMDLLFSPFGYQDAIVYRGHRVRVREPDGIHLNVSGQAIAAAEITEALGES